MTKLLIIATIPGTLGGFILPFVRYFRHLGWQVDGMAQDIENCAVCPLEFDRVWNVRWSRNPLDPRNLAVAVPRIREVVAQGNYDLVHVHTPVAAFVTRYALKDRQHKPQVIYTAHGFHFHRGGNPLTNNIFLALEKFAGRWTDYLITINREDESAAKEYNIVPADKIYYTPGIGVDIGHYDPNSISLAETTAIREELGLAPQDKLFLCVAEFTKNKRHRDILSALKQLSRAEVHLALAGDGTERANIEKLAVELGLQGRVHFLGFRPDIPALIRTSVAVLLASQREGLPRSIMEALCLETTVIGSDIRGTRDLLSDSCGILFPVGDVTALTSAMSFILDNSDKAIAMGRKGRQKMLNYDVQKIIQAYSQLYDRALNNT
jgi:glycosyltransferase involved in cell wall biosynthesis